MREKHREDEEVVEYIFKQYQTVLDKIICKKDWFPNTLHEKLGKAWNELKRTGIETAKSKIYETQDDIRSKLEDYGLNGNQWEFKRATIDMLQDIFTRKTIKRIAIKLLKAINVVLCSLISAFRVPGLEVMKEFKDFVEIAIAI